jgi:branched-chain amino acid aminotransferase
MEPTKYIWMDGALVPWEEATVHVLSHALHYGTGVFEGIRAYQAERGTAVFRLTDHMDRLHRSAKAYSMDLEWSVADLTKATKELLAENGLTAGYVRPIVFLELGAVGLNPTSAKVRTAIITWEWGAYLGEEGLANGIRVAVSSWRRFSTDSFPNAKATGTYVNSILAKLEALKAGYDEAIMLNSEGLVSECTGENILVARGGRFVTPPLSAGALEGITQDSVTTIARDLGFEVLSADVTRSDLYVADEMFVCGTAAEVSAVNSVDDRALPCPGPMTTEIAREFAKAVRGQIDRYKDWCEHVA